MFALTYYLSFSPLHHEVMGRGRGWGNKNAPRFREALCVLRYRLLRLILSKHKTLTGEPGGSGHGHSTEAVRIHNIGRYSMTEVELCQGINAE